MKIGTVHLVIVMGMLAGCSEQLHAPLEQMSRRPTPLSFGMDVTNHPDHNPIDPPERFSGYHVGTDYEVSSAELDTDVPIFAICTGTSVFKGILQGYGGLFVEECRIAGEDVIVIYGHMSLQGLPQVDDRLRAGDRIGILAPARSKESDGNRKHLHLGIRRGLQLDVRGYVQSEEELRLFIDPITVLPSRFLNAAMPDVVPYWKEDAR